MITARYIISIDVGTTGYRTVIFSGDGDLVCQAYEEYTSVFISPTWIDHDPATWMRAAKQTLNKALNEFPGDRKNIVAIAVVSQRSTVVPVDEQGTPLDNAMLWQDKRATPQAEHIREQAGEDNIYKKTGLRIDPYFTLPKLLWMQENKPEILEKTYKLLSVHGLIMHALTGEFVTDWTQAARTMLFNIETLEWDEDLCERFGISRDLLPEAVPPGSIAGMLSGEAQREYGLGAVPVVSVGGDQQAAAVGLGVVRPGLMCVNTGTGSFILAHADRPMFDVQQRIICTASAVSGKWLLEASIFTTGSVYRWFRDNLAIIEKNTAENLHIDAYDILEDELKQSPPGSGGILFIPHFAGSATPYWNPEAAGIIFGLSLGHTRDQLIRALLEGLCFEINKNIRIIESLIGGITEIRVSGGATRSATFTRMQADIYGKPVERGSSEQSTALGAMLIAATAVGLYPDIIHAVDSVVRFESNQRIEPDRKLSDMYQRLNTLHDDIYHALNERDIYHRAHEIRCGMHSQEK
ncbi:FGGY-family carbohydrate kinase [Candidatus Latescibacterota bacterium]